MQLPKNLSKKLQERKKNNSFRELPISKELIDFSSNDYLGFAKSTIIFEKTHKFLDTNNLKRNGATGSRLLSGNYPLFAEIESFLANFHKRETATIFNSGYNANLGFFGTFPQRGDIILYDEFIHASIREGILLSNAKSYKFKHNTLHDLEDKILKHKKDKKINKTQHIEIYVVTESVFSMDGDIPNLLGIAEICKKHNVLFVVDEAHAVGVFEGGLVEKNNLQDAVFATIITFGKAIGCHGAAILGSKDLKDYLVNFARSFIYTTALSPHSLATIRSSYYELLNINNKDNPTKNLHKNILHFQNELKKLKLNFIASNSAIQCCIISGNAMVKKVSHQLQQEGFDVKAVLSPTVPEGKERLRFCLHSYNSKKEITQVLELLSKFVQ